MQLFQRTLRSSYVTWFMSHDPSINVQKTAPFSFCFLFLFQFLQHYFSNFSLKCVKCHFYKNLTCIFMSWLFWGWTCFQIGNDLNQWIWCDFFSGKILKKSKILNFSKFFCSLFTKKPLKRVNLWLNQIIPAFKRITQLPNHPIFILWKCYSANSKWKMFQT